MRRRLRSLTFYNKTMVSGAVVRNCQMQQKKTHYYPTVMKVPLCLLYGVKNTASQ